MMSSDDDEYYPYYPKKVYDEDDEEDEYDGPSIPRRQNKNQLHDAPESSRKDLKIDLYNYKDNASRSASMEEFDKTMILYEAEGVDSLSIGWFTQNRANVDNESLRVNRWLQSASKGNVKEIHLDIMLPEEKSFALPRLGCTSLSSLTINTHRKTLELPSLGFFSLSTLSLKEVKLNCSLGKVISLSKRLKRLSLEEVSGIEKLKISSNSLKEVWITKTDTDDLKTIHIEGEWLQTVKVAWYFFVPDEKHFEVSGSRLKTLNWRGDVVQSCDIFVSLEEASCNFRPPRVKINEKMKTSLVGLVRAVDGVKRLELNCWHIEILTKDCQVGTFHNLSDLVINVWDFNEEHQIPAIASFLGTPSRLKNLSFKNCRQPWRVRIGELMGLEKSMYANREVKNMFSQLRSVQIELTGGNKELELANYLTNHARKLKKMTVLYSPLDMHRLEQINRSINGCKKASSDMVTQIMPYV